MTVRIPLYGRRAQTGRNDFRGLIIRLSDCEGSVPPPDVEERHRELQEKIDRWRVKDGEQYGWIEHDGGEVTDWYVDEELL